RVTSLSRVFEHSRKRAVVDARARTAACRGWSVARSCLATVVRGFGMCSGSRVRPCEYANPRTREPVNSGTRALPNDRRTVPTHEYIVMPRDLLASAPPDD